MGIGVHGGAGGGTSADPSEVNIVEYGSTATTLGQKAMAAAVPVVIASDQSAIPTTIAGNTTATGIIDANSEFVSIAVPSGGGSIGIQITGTWSGQIDFQATIDGTNWVAVNTSDGSSTINATAFNGIFVTAGGGFATVRAISTSWASGSATITMGGSVGTGPVLLSAPLPQGANLLGKVGIDQTTPGTTNAVQANAGTNLNTSALALETTQAAQLSRADTFKTRSDTFTAAANGVTVDASASPVSVFGIQVKMTGTVTSWDMRLEGSLNNSEFTTILTHTNATGDGVTLWIGSLKAPALYFRSRCAAIALNGGTNVVVTILGKN